MSILNRKVDVLVLDKFQEIQHFTRTAIQNIDSIVKEQNFDKNSVFMNPDMRPLTLNVQKAVDMIMHFKLEPFKDRSFRPSQINTQSRSTHYEIDEDPRRTLPPLDLPKHNAPNIKTSLNKSGTP
jgi:hypothetical protein